MTVEAMVSMSGMIDQRERFDTRFRSELSWRDGTSATVQGTESAAPAVVRRMRPITAPGTSGTNAARATSATVAERPGARRMRRGRASTVTQRHPSDRR